MAIIYETGLSPFVLADLYHARTLLIEAAELQYLPALYKLANCFESGTVGFPVNLVSLLVLFFGQKSWASTHSFFLNRVNASNCIAYPPILGMLRHN